MSEAAPIGRRFARPLATMTACWLVVASGWSTSAWAEGSVALIRVGDRLRIVVPMATSERARLEQRGSQGRLVFDAPTELEVPELGGTAADFLDELELREGGRALVFGIPRGMTATRALSGPKQFVVEIRAATAERALEPAARATPEPAPPSQPAGTPIRLRSGKHQGYVRLVIEGITADNFKLEREEQTIRLVGTFRDAKDVLAGLRELGPPITTVQQGQGAIAIGLGPFTRVDQSGAASGRIVLDLHPGKELVIEPAAGPVRTPPGTRAAAEAAPEENGAIPFAFPVMRPPVDAAPAPTQAAIRNQAIMGMDKVPAEVASTVARELDTATTPAPVAPEAPLAIRGFGGSGVNELILAWPGPGPTPASIFLYGGELWTVFPRNATDIDADRATLAKSLGGAIRRVRRETVPDATVLRFELARPRAIKVQRREQEWVIRLDDPATAAKPTGKGTEPVRDKDKLVLGKSGSLVELDAALGGAPMTVLTSIDPEVRMVEGHRFVDLEFMPTAQGFVWRHVADGVSAETVGGRTVIGRENGLRLGEPLLDLEPVVALAKPTVPPADPAKPETAAHGAEPAQADHAQVAHGSNEPAQVAKADHGHGEPAKADQAQGKQAKSPPIGKIEPPEPPRPKVEGIALAGRSSAIDDVAREQERELVEKLAGLFGEAARQQRYEIARHLLARGLSAEALHFLGSEEPGTIPADPTDRALQAVTSVQLARFAPAAESLADKSLEGNQEAALWRAIALAEQERWADAAKSLQTSGRVFSSYPQLLQRRYGPLVARIAAEAGRANAAFATIDRLRNIELDEREKARLDYVDALTRERDGQLAEARKLLEGLVRGSDRDYQTRARFALTRMGLEKGQLTPGEAARQLQEQQLTWRGHPEEPEFLALLANVQSKAGTPAAALSTYKTQLQRYPEDPRNDVSADAMQALFRDAVAGKSKPPLAPLDALEIYRSYPELLPASEDGARLLRDLARRLSMADLPKTAANLLEEAVLVRAEETARPSIALEAAEQRLADGDKEGAKRLLDTYPPPANAPADVHARQAKIRAALLGGPALVAEHEGTGPSDPAAAQRRQLDAAWAGRDWQKVLEIGRGLLEQQPEGAPLAEKDRSLPLRMAVAAAAAGDRSTLAAIDTGWSKPLANTAEGRMLRLLVGAGEIDAGGIDQVIAALDAKAKAMRDGLGATKR